MLCAGCPAAREAGWLVARLVMAGKVVRCSKPRPDRRVALVVRRSPG